MTRTSINRISSVELVRYVGVLDVDYDIDANKIIVLDRTTCSVLRSVLLKSTPNPLRFIMPKNYCDSNDIIVIITDDDLVNNAAAADGVKCELVNLSAT